MTVCKKCGRFMNIVSTRVDYEGGDEEFEFEACTSCRIIYVSGGDEWTVKLG